MQDANRFTAQTPSWASGAPFLQAALHVEIGTSHLRRVQREEWGEKFHEIPRDVSSALEWLFPHLLWASLSQTHLPVRLARWGLIEIWTLTEQVTQIIGHHYIRGKSPQSTKIEHAKTSEYHGGNCLMTSPGWVPKMPGHELRTSGGAIQNDERWNSSDLTVTGGRFESLEVWILRSLGQSTQSMF